MNTMQERFCAEYIKDHNAARAYIRAGYKPTSIQSACACGRKLLDKSEIAAKIAADDIKAVERAGVTADMVLRELAAVGFSRGTDYAEIDDGGVVRLTPTGQLSEEQKSAVAGIDFGKNGIKIKLCDKVKALELLGRHLGMFEQAQKGADDDAETGVVLLPEVDKADE